jgi:putative PIN family toxin of toxin-antitoxin system
MRILLDVNILASAGPGPSSLPGMALAIASSPDHQLIISDDMREKLAEVLESPYFASRMTQLQQFEFVQLIGSIGQRHEPDETVVNVADDTEDDRILGTAVAGNAEVIVSGDKGLLKRNPFRGIPILTAREFIDEVDPGRLGDR